MRYIHLVGDALISYLHIKIKSDKMTGFEETMQSTKLLMYELFSNAVRHSPDKKVDIIFDFTLNFLAINIETEGPEFVIRPKNDEGAAYHYPYKDTILGANFPVYQDNDEEVICHVVNDSCLEFCRQPAVRKGADEVEVPDHFGMLFLTTICNDVKYIRTKAGVNIFSVKKHFPNEAVK